MRGANRRRTGASSSASIASTSTKREREEESASAADESSDGEVPSSSASESESESGGEDAERERELERALADVPFGELQRARADGSLARATSAAKAAAEKKARRVSKRRPMEISTKVRPPKLREVIQVPKKVGRDPRFEPVYGSVDKEGFRKRYNFLFDEDFPAEKERLQKMIKKSKDPDAIGEMKSRVTWIVKSHPPKNVESEILREHIKKEREAAKAGKRPYYLKKSELRERKLMNKYNELKEAGKLDAFMEKRRKKNASKDHRFMPYRRSGDA
uniref:rRNA biogenesis protein RRP36 n=1 Tax=Zea mays TaxID=4577 RepID=A0A804MQ16_MAIZE